jgi:hypothetical protein
MREGVASTMIAAMPTRRLIIELEATALPRGRVVGIRGEEIEFAGWVELVAAVERARGAPAPSEPVQGMLEHRSCDAHRPRNRVVGAGSVTGGVSTPMPGSRRAVKLIPTTVEPNLEGT